MGLKFPKSDFRFWASCSGSGVPQASSLNLELNLFLRY